MHTDHDIDVLGTHSTVPHGAVTGKLIEQHGIDTIPESERHSSPKTIFMILIGAQLTYGVIVAGWLPVALGLGWWSSVTALILGLLIGSAILAPMALLGPRSGTNGAVSSGAFFWRHWSYHRIGSFDIHRHRVLRPDGMDGRSGSSCGPPSCVWDA